MVSPRGSNILPIMGRPLGPGGSFKLGGLPFHFRICGGTGFTPNFAGSFGDKAQLGFLFGLCQQIAFQSGRKAALRAQGEPLDGNKGLGRMDSTLEIVLALQCRFFGTDQTQNDCPAVRNLPERVETSGALIIEFEQISLEFRPAKDFRDRSVIARGVELTLVVSPAKV